MACSATTCLREEADTALVLWSLGLQPACRSHADACRRALRGAGRRVGLLPARATLCLDAHRTRLHTAAQDCLQPHKRYHTRTIVLNMRFLVVIKAHEEGAATHCFLIRARAHCDQSVSPPPCSLRCHRQGPSYIYARSAWPAAAAARRLPVERAAGASGAGKVRRRRSVARARGSGSSGSLDAPAAAAAATGALQEGHGDQGV